MTVEMVGHIGLPEHRGGDGIDHADVHSPSDPLYGANTANDALDIIDCPCDRYRESITGLAAVARALVSDAWGLVLTSNRREKTVALFAAGAEQKLTKIPVGLVPNCRMSSP
jgi:hypothetical protein